MCKDVLRLRAQIGGDWVVTFGLPTRCHLSWKNLFSYLFFTPVCVCGELVISIHCSIYHRRAREIVVSQLGASIMVLEVILLFFCEMNLNNEKLML